MSEQFNQEMSLSGKIPSGHFNHMFELSSCWQKDAANTKSLAFDGWFITLYTVALSQPHTMLRDHVKQAVPSSWDPSALAKYVFFFHLTGSAWVLVRPICSQIYLVLI
jgi:MAC/Perforin domain